MKKILLLIILISSLSAYKIIDDDEFVSQDFSFQETLDFVELFPNNRLTIKEIRFIFIQCEYFEIHPVVVFTWMEKESGIFTNPPEEPRYTKLLNLCMGYGLIYRKRMYNKKHYKYYSFNVQVLLMTSKFRQFYDRWEHGKGVYVKNIKKKVYPENASTYAILTLNPYMGNSKENGKINAGAELFGKVFYKLKIKWITKTN